MKMCIHVNRGMKSSLTRYDNVYFLFKALYAYYIYYKHISKASPTISVNVITVRVVVLLLSKELLLEKDKIHCLHLQ